MATPPSVQAGLWGVLAGSTLLAGAAVAGLMIGLRASVVNPTVLLRRLRLLFPRVLRGDDFADAGLVEALEALVALQVLQVRAECALLLELLSLISRNPAASQESLNTFGAYRPHFALGER